MRLGAPGLELLDPNRTPTLTLTFGVWVVGPGIAMLATTRLIAYLLEYLVTYVLVGRLGGVAGRDVAARRAECDPHHSCVATPPRHGDDSGLGQGQGRGQGRDARSRADARQKHAAGGAIQTQEEQRQVRGAALIIKDRRNTYVCMARRVTPYSLCEACACADATWTRGAGE